MADELCKHFRMKHSTPLHAPERSGDSLKGGGHPADVTVPEAVENEEMAGYTVTGHAKTPGIADPGVPGSKTNPADPDKQPQPALSDPVPPKKGDESP